MNSKPGRKKLLVVVLFLFLFLGACSAQTEATNAPMPTEMLENSIQFDTVEQAQAQITFPLLVPELPQEFELTSVTAWEQPHGREAVMAQYSNGQADVDVQQTWAPEGMTPPPDQPYQEVQIRGRDAYLVTAQGEPAAYALIWWENDVIVSISSSGLTQEEMFQISEGLHLLK